MFNAHTSVGVCCCMHVQVETIGVMKIREKAEILLEQVRLCLAKKDFIRAEIISNKVNTKALEGNDMQVHSWSFVSMERDW